MHPYSKHPYTKKKSIAIMKNERQNDNEYLMPLFDLIKDIFNVRLNRFYNYKDKYVPRLIVVHILKKYIGLPCSEINKILKLSSKTSKDYERMFKEHPKNNLLSNISYDIYHDYLNELKKIDLKENSNED